MSSYTFDTLASLASATPSDYKKQLWQSKKGEPFMEIKKGVLNVISVERMERSAMLSLRIAMSLAARAECDVTSWEIGDSTKQEQAVVTERRPISDGDFADKPQYDPRLLPKVKKIMYINTYLGRPALEQHSRHYANSLEEFEYRRTVAPVGVDPLSGLPMSIVHVPTGTWKEHFETIREDIRKGGFDVVFVNSFEYAHFTVRHRQRMVEDLIRLDHEFPGITIVVFSTQIRAEMRAGTVGAGPIGLLIGYCQHFMYLLETPDGDFVGQYVLPKKKKNERDAYTQDPEPAKNAKPVVPVMPENQWERDQILSAKGHDLTLADMMELNPFSMSPAKVRELIADGELDDDMLRQAREMGFQ